MGLVPLWDGREPWALEPLACQRAWQLRQLREPYRSEEAEALIRSVHAKWTRAVTPDWALIESELREKAGCLSPVTAQAPSAPENPGSRTQDDPEKDQPRDTMAVRVKATKWLADFVTNGEYIRRDDTLTKMRAEHPGLGVRGSKQVFKDYSNKHPELKLSRAGPKPKRNTNN